MSSFFWYASLCPLHCTSRTFHNDFIRRRVYIHVLCTYICILCVIKKFTHTNINNVVLNWICNWLVIFFCSHNIVQFDHYLGHVKGSLVRIKLICQNLTQIENMQTTPPFNNYTNCLGCTNCLRCT